MDRVAIVLIVDARIVDVDSSAVRGDADAVIVVAVLDTYTMTSWRPCLG